MNRESRETMSAESMTLHELCLASGISRRAIQGYEQAGLVRASGRNKRGYLLYDPAAQQKVLKVRQYQRFGFSLREIAELEKLSGGALKRRLEAQYQKLLLEKQELERDVALLGDIIRSMENH